MARTPYIVSRALNNTHWQGMTIPTGIEGKLILVFIQPQCEVTGMIPSNPSYTLIATDSLLTFGNVGNSVIAMAKIADGNDQTWFTGGTSHGDCGGTGFPDGPKYWWHYIIIGDAMIPTQYSSRVVDSSSNLYAPALQVGSALYITSLHDNEDAELTGAPPFRYTDMVSIEHESASIGVFGGIGSAYHYNVGDTSIRPWGSTGLTRYITYTMAIQGSIPSKITIGVPNGLKVTVDGNVTKDNLIIKD